MYETSSTTASHRCRIPPLSHIRRRPRLVIIPPLFPSPLNEKIIVKERRETDILNVGENSFFLYFFSFLYRFSVRFRENDATLLRQWTDESPASSKSWKSKSARAKVDTRRVASVERSGEQLSLLPLRLLFLLRLLAVSPLQPSFPAAFFILRFPRNKNKKVTDVCVSRHIRFLRGRYTPFAD